MLIETVDGFDKFLANVAFFGSCMGALEFESRFIVIGGIFIPLSGFWVDVLGSLGELEEVVHGSCVEELCVGF
jgi:hypothetical protein